MIKERIEIHAKREAISTIKNILYRFLTDLPKISTTVDSETSMIIFQFSIDGKYLKSAIEKFISAGLHVEPINSPTKKILRDINESLISEGKTPKPTIITKKSPTNEFISVKSLKEILLIAEPYIKQQKKITNKTKDEIFSATELLVQKYEKKALARKTSAIEYLDYIIEIATNKNLKFLNDNRIFKSAGNSAIRICLEYQHLVSELIEIANNREYDSEINIKAALKFADKINEEPEKHEEDLVIAVRRLNTKYLLTVLDVAGKNFTKAEIEKLNNFINFLRNQR